MTPAVRDLPHVHDKGAHRRSPSASCSTGCPPTVLRVDTNCLVKLCTWMDSPTLADGLHLARVLPPNGISWLKQQFIGGCQDGFIDDCSEFVPFVRYAV